MSAERDELAGLVVQYVVEILGGRFSMTEEQIRDVAENDPAMGEILSGLLFLHQDLLHRERERSRAEAELLEQNRILEESRAKLEALASELSTPVIRVWKGVIMLPLVGRVDAARGAEITERLLTAVEAEKATYAIVDITGVPAIDSTTADQFVRMVRSIELLGARAIVAGAQPSLVLTVTGLGIDLRGIRSVRNLEEALLLAMSHRAHAS